MVPGVTFPYVRTVANLKRGGGTAVASAAVAWDKEDVYTYLQCPCRAGYADAFYRVPGALREA